MPFIGKQPAVRSFTLLDSIMEDPAFVSLTAA